MEHQTPLVEIKDLSISFGGIKAVDHVSIELYPGEVVGLLGHNGAGKSTLIKCLSGAYQADSGEIRVNGKPVTIGWGSTRDFEGRPIKMGTVWTQAECDRKKAEDMAAFERSVAKALGDALAATSQPQFDALVSFAYNIGPKAFLTQPYTPSSPFAVYVAVISADTNATRARNKIIATAKKKNT